MQHSTRQPCAYSILCHCCAHPCCARYMHDEDTPRRERSSRTPLRLMSVEAWKAVYDGPTAALNTNRALKVLYDWYKILIDCVERGVVPDRVQQVHMLWCLLQICAAGRTDVLAAQARIARHVHTMRALRPRRTQPLASVRLTCAQLLYYDAFCPAQMLHAPSKALHQAAALEAITEVGRQSSQGSGQLRCVACCVLPQYTVRTSSLLHPQACNIGETRTSLTLC